MLPSISMLSFLLGTLSIANAQSASTLPDVLDADTIASLGNNSLFLRWRSRSHFIAPAGWMNDPCAMMYDPSEDTYHLMYQWHPYHINWGNISWGHATSKDLITWTDVGGWEGDNAQSLGTTGNGTYNGLGIFSGTVQPVNLTGGQDGTLLAFYTSVSYLPTNWALPYIDGTETQSLAISNDGGLTWEDYENNPVISQPPDGWNVTGWRDPFFEPWPEIDAILQQEEPHYYAVLGSGIKQVGPRIPFYSAPASDLTNWTFLGALWEPRNNETLGEIIETGTYGFNFEVSNFFSLTDNDGDVHYYIMMGTEGGNTTFHPRAQWGLWNEGIVTRRSNGSAQFSPVSGGAIDSGLLYAVTSFDDTKNNRRVQWGWANDELNNYQTQQGFQGSFALPREMYVKKTTGLINTDGRLTTRGNNRVIGHSDGTFTAYTLGARPLPDVVNGIRNGTSQRNYATNGTSTSSALIGTGSNHMELKATLRNITGSVGLTVAASPGGEEYTTISWNPSNYTVNVDRSQSSSIENIARNYTVIGYFYPYTYAESGIEDIEINVFIDGSLLELYINDRFWLTTRIYPGRLDSTGFGVFVGDNASVEVSGLTVWTDTADIFPGRPLNSSSRLVYDTPEQTNNYTWWTGN
ncbi:glycosyl hydrolase-like proteins family 32 superfamily [Byssothecium circinans]|uniref:Glycosyl hydrolase-like proteins family 32 superfamily n=1 Tax=Byssothecium circinans TaxID=147558 RepID=A0A6A5TXQ6_9PLEO|nr:glycosyl hydrolase-like proteins family 32 superfamily [Byssothecium circinans]